MQPEQGIKSFITDEGEQSWQDIVAKLKFISGTKEGQKIDIRTLQTVNNDYWTSAWRTWRTYMSCEESREMTLKWIKLVLGDAFAMCSKYVSCEEEFYQKLSSTIGLAIQDSKTGLVSLAKTYSADTMFVSKLNALIVLINTKIEELSKAYPNIITIVNRAGVIINNNNKF